MCRYDVLFCEDKCACDRYGYVECGCQASGVGERVFIPLFKPLDESPDFGEAIDATLTPDSRLTQPRHRRSIDDTGAATQIDPLNLI